MTLCPLTIRKSNHATWLLAVVVFLSGFTFSGSVQDAKADNPKTKTELVVSANTRGKKNTINPFVRIGSSTAELSSSKISQVIHLHNLLTKVRFDSMLLSYQTFCTDLHYHSFFFSIPDSEFSPLVG